MEPQDPYYLYAKYCSFNNPPDWALEERNISREAAGAYGIQWNKGWVIPIWAPHRVKDITQDFWGWQFKRMDRGSQLPPGPQEVSHTLRHEHAGGGHEAVLVESPLDVVRMSMVGLPAIAAYGAMVSSIR